MRGWWRFVRTTPCFVLLAVQLSGHARSVVMLEQIVGMFYVAMVVTRLVALRGQRQDRRQAGDAR